MPRLSIAQQLAVAAHKDPDAFDHLMVGECSSVVFLDAYQVEADDDANGSIRLLVERSLGQRNRLVYELQIETEKEWFPVFINNKREKGVLDHGVQIAELYPFWAEYTRRIFREIQETQSQHVHKAIDIAEKGAGARVCARCAYDAGGKYILGSPKARPGVCPSCEMPGMIHPVETWTDLPKAFVDSVKKASAEADGVPLWLHGPDNPPKEEGAGTSLDQWAAERGLRGS